MASRMDRRVGLPRLALRARGWGRALTGGLGGALGVASVACGDDARILTAGAELPGAAPSGPLYVISTGVVSGDEFLGYLATVDSLEAGSTFNLDDAAEVGAGAWIFNRPGDASVYVASLEDATIVRWEVLGPGQFARRETLDFRPLGVDTAYFAASAPIFSAEKSYFVDEAQDQIVIWNPSRMEAIGAIDLGDDFQAGLQPAPEGALLFHGDQMLVSVGWRAPDDTSTYGAHVRLVTIDTNTDQIIDSTIERRNVQAALNTQASDGTAYYSPYSLYAAYTEIGSGHGAPSITLRINPDQDGFDPNYQLDLGALVGGRPAGDLTLLDDDTALIRAWHPELVDPVDPTNWQDVLWGEAGFMWWRWNIGEPSAVEIPNQEPGALGASVFKLDGRTYSTLYAADLSSTTLVEITPAVEFIPALQGPGQFIGAGVLRIR